jgi:uncharacterized iron-regulated membrane protein
MTVRRRILRFARKLHIWVGLIAALYFMLIAATGVMINHRGGLRLEERNVSRSWLPNGYRTQDGSAVRADIVVTDLHSGLIFGKIGAPVLDFVAAVWFISIISGLSMLALRRSMHYTQSKKVYLPSPPAADQKPAQTAAQNSRKALAGAGRTK